MQTHMASVGVYNRRALHHANGLSSHHGADQAVLPKLFIRPRYRLGHNTKLEQFSAPRYTHRNASASAASSEVPEPSPAATEPEPVQKKGVIQSIKRFFVGDKLDKQRLAALGMGAFASYGVISNVTYGTCMMIAWISFVKAKGISPLAPGQWPAFLVFYAGLFTFQNIVRPLRFSLAIALAPVFDRFIDTIKDKLNVDKKIAFGVLLGIIFVSTCTFVFGGLYLLGGFPPIK